MAFSQQQEKTRPLSIFKILCEAFKLSTKSFTLILPILIIYFASSNLLTYLYFTYLPIPDLTSIGSLDHKNPDYAQLTSNILEYLKYVSPLLSVIFITSVVLSSLLDITAIHGFTFVRNSSKHPTLSDLFRNLCGGLKGRMMTSLYVTLLKLTSIASLDPKNPDYAQLTSNILEYLKDASPLLSVIFITSVVLSSLLDIAAIQGFTFVRNSTKHPCGGLKGPMITSPYVALLKLTSIASLDPKNPDYAQLTSNILEYLKDVSPLLSVIFITSVVLSSLLDIAAIHGFTFVRNSSKHPTHSDLFHNLCGGLKGPMITSLYVALLKLGYVLLILVIFVASIAQGSLVLIAFGTITVLVSPFLYLYVSMVWSVSVVASVVEDGCYGLEAISKAWKITKGRRIRGVLLTLTGLAIVSVVSFVYDFKKGYVNSLSTTEKMGIGFVYGLVFLVIRTFEWAISMVFYDDCKSVNAW